MKIAKQKLLDILEDGEAIVLNKLIDTSRWSSIYRKMV